MNGELVVYMRHGCHICEEAEEAVRPLAREAGLRLTLIDIETDDELLRRYLEAIPVIVLDGEELARIVEFRDGRVERALAARADRD